jgi:hypothetical protein
MSRQIYAFTPLSSKPHLQGVIQTGRNYKLSIWADRTIMYLVGMPNYGVLCEGFGQIPQLEGSIITGRNDGVPIWANGAIVYIACVPSQGG